MSASDYSWSERLLHGLALGWPVLARASFELESLLAPAPVLAVETPHLFIAGLARAGTTALLRALHATGLFRSLTYRDMPFVLMPTTWRRISALSPRDVRLRERMHGDGILVDADSPEAFEEIFWRVFCGPDYVTPGGLLPHAPDRETIDLFRQFVGRVLDGYPGLRYLSKNNNNILRLPAIRAAWPRAVLLVPFRDPLQHAISLWRQQQRFEVLQQRDPFMLRYMTWLGHHEFGAGRRPFLLHGWDGAGAEGIEGWLVQWRAVHGHLAALEGVDALFLAYEDLCREPARMLHRLAERAALDPAVLLAQAGSLVAPPVREMRGGGVDGGLLQGCREIYEALRDRSVRD